MSSNPIVWALDSTVGLDPGKLYEVRGQRWAYPAPVACPRGHLLGPLQALVGAMVCPAVPGTSCHRTYTCRTCEAVIMWPPETAECDHRPFGDR